MLNSWTGMGRLTKDPEMRKTQNGKSVATFTIAVDRDFDRETTDFVPCVAWRNTADFVSKHFSKGQLEIINGAWQSRKWKDKDGNNHLTWEVNVNNIYFGGDKRQAVSAFEEIADDEEIPF